MKNFGFWQKWLVFFGIVAMLFCAGLMFPAVLNSDLPYISDTFWGSSALSEETMNFYKWVLGVYAAIGVSWSISIVFVACYPFKKKEKWSWYCLFVCITVWFVIDTVFSLSFGFYVNAVNNSIFYTLLILPLIFTKKEFT